MAIIVTKVALGKISQKKSELLVIARFSKI
jgi:hypothetical protein